MRASNYDKRLTVSEALEQLVGAVAQGFRPGDVVVFKKTGRIGIVEGLSPVPYKLKIKWLSDESSAFIEDHALRLASPLEIAQSKCDTES